MSSYYSIYTEAKINDNWVCIDASVPKLERDDNHKLKSIYKQHLTETYWNGSRSYFGTTYDKLREIGSYSKLADLSPQVQQQFRKYLDDEKDNDDCWIHPIVVSWGSFAEYVDLNKFDSHGLVHKDYLFAWENGDIEEIYPVEHDVFSELMDEEKQAYVYHEWDSPWDWNSHFKEIYKNARHRISDFKDVNYIYDNADMPIRLVVIEC